MIKQKGYRIPAEHKPCKFGQHNWEYLGEKWMGQCDSFECTYVGDKQTIPANEVCEENDKCLAYEPCETKICPIHDIEFYADEVCEICHPEIELDNQ